MMPGPYDGGMGMGMRGPWPPGGGVRPMGAGPYGAGVRRGPSPRPEGDGPSDAGSDSAADDGGHRERESTMGNLEPGAGRAPARGAAVMRPGRPTAPTAAITVINIPPELLKIDKLNEFFAQFGTIVNLQVRVGVGGRGRHVGGVGPAAVTEAQRGSVAQLHPENRTASIHFSAPGEATRAVRSREAVFGNRYGPRVPGPCAHTHTHIHTPGPSPPATPRGRR